MSACIITVGRRTRHWTELISLRLGNVCRALTLGPVSAGQGLGNVKTYMRGCAICMSLPALFLVLMYGTSTD